MHVIFALDHLKLYYSMQELAEEHYSDLSSKPFYKGLVQYMIRWRMTLSSPSLQCRLWRTTVQYTCIHLYTYNNICKVLLLVKQ